MIAHKRATHQMTVEFKFLQVSLRPSTMNTSPYHNGSCKTVKGPEIQNLKLNIKHDNRPKLMQKR